MKLLKKFFVFISLFFLVAFPVFADSNCPAVSSSALPDTSGNITIHLTNNRTTTTNGEVEVIFHDSSITTTSPTLFTDENEELFFHDVSGTDWIDAFDGTHLIAGTFDYNATLNNPSHLTSLNIDVSQFNGDSWCTSNLTLTNGGGGGGGAGVTLDPTVEANLSAGLGSVGTMILSTAVNNLPVILIMAGTIFVISFAVSFLFSKAKRHE